MLGSSDPTFRSDPSRYNLFVSSLSACHSMWHLGLAARANIVVTHYTDHAVGTMIETAAGSGKFTEAILRPAITVKAGTDLALAHQLHGKAHHFCFIAKPVNFPVRCKLTFHAEME